MDWTTLTSQIRDEDRLFWALFRQYVIADDSPGWAWPAITIAAIEWASHCVRQAKQNEGRFTPFPSKPGVVAQMNRVIAGQQVIPGRLRFGKIHRHNDDTYN